MNVAEEKLLERVDILIKLTAANVIQDKEFREQVKLLNSVGLRPKEIAGILRKTPNNINVTLSLLKKQKARSKSGKK